MVVVGAVGGFEAAEGLEYCVVFHHGRVVERVRPDLQVGTVAEVGRTVVAGFVVVASVVASVVVVDVAAVVVGGIDCFLAVVDVGSLLL